MTEVEEYLKKKGWHCKDAGTNLQVQECPMCGDTDNHFYINRETGAWDCKKCFATGGIYYLKKELGDIKISSTGKQRIVEFKDFKEVFEQEGYDWLHKKRGLSDETIKAFPLIYGKDRIGFKYKTPDNKTYKLKVRMTETKDFYYKPKGAIHYPWGIEKLDASLGYVLLCEGEIDAMSWYQYGVKNVVSIPGATNFKGAWIELLQKFKVVYVSMDSDEAGDFGAEGIVNKLKDHVVVKKVLLPFKDANECLLQGVSKERMQNAVKEAKEIQNESIVHIGAIPLRRATKEDFGYSTGFASLDKMTRWRKKEITVITAKTKSGKTSLTANFALNQAIAGHPVLIGSFEEPKEDIQRKMASMIIGKNFFEMTDEELEIARNKLSMLPILFIDHYGYIEMDKLKGCIHYAAKYLDTKFVLLDHLQFMVRTTSSDQVHAFGEAMRGLRQVVLETEVHCWLVSQSRRMAQGQEVDSSTLRGSGEIEQIANKVIAVKKHEEADSIDLMMDIARHMLDKVGCTTFSFNTESQLFSDGELPPKAWAEGAEF